MVIGTSFVSTTVPALSFKRFFVTDGRTFLPNIYLQFSHLEFFSHIIERAASTWVYVKSRYISKKNHSENKENSRHGGNLKQDETIRDFVKLGCTEVRAGITKKKTQNNTLIEK